jgi:hypothetical protein
MDSHSPAVLRDHAYALAKAFGVLLLEGSELKGAPEAAFAELTTRTVVVAPITDESTYAIALHELGHLEAPLGQLRGSPGLQREAEDAAWAWAKHYALVWTPFMQHVATWARRSYDELPARKPEPPAPVAPIGQQIDWENWK